MEFLEREEQTEINAQTRSTHCTTAKNIRNKIKSQITPLLSPGPKRPLTSLIKDFKETRNHSFKDVELVPIKPVFDPYGPKQNALTIDTNYQVIVLKKPASLRWLRTRRLMLFMQSSLYCEFKLARILREYRQKIKNTKELSSIKITKIKLTDELNNDNFNPL